MKSPQSRARRSVKRNGENRGQKHVEAKKSSSRKREGIGETGSTPIYGDMHGELLDLDDPVVLWKVDVGLEIQERALFKVQDQDSRQAGRELEAGARRAFICDGPFSERRRDAA
eukprot:2564492-Rhodomonas_salina.2